MTTVDRSRIAGILWDTFLYRKSWNRRKQSLKTLPGAGTSRSGESDPRYRFNQGGFPRALRSDDGDHG